MDDQAIIERRRREASKALEQARIAFNSSILEARDAGLDVDVSLREMQTVGRKPYSMVFTRVSHTVVTVYQDDMAIT